MAVTIRRESTQYIALREVYRYGLWDWDDPTNIITYGLRILGAPLRLWEGVCFRVTHLKNQEEFRWLFWCPWIGTALLVVAPYISNDGMAVLAMATGVLFWTIPPLIVSIFLALVLAMVTAIVALAVLLLGLVVAISPVILLVVVLKAYGIRPSFTNVLGVEFVDSD